MLRFILLLIILISNINSKEMKFKNFGITLLLSLFFVGYVNCQSINNHPANLEIYLLIGGGCFIVGFFAGRIVELWCNAPVVEEE